MRICEVWLELEFMTDGRKSLEMFLACARVALE